MPKTKAPRSACLKPALLRSFPLKFLGLHSGWWKLLNVCLCGTIWGLIPVGAESLALAVDRTVLNANQYFRIRIGPLGEEYDAPDF